MPNVKYVGSGYSGHWEMIIANMLSEREIPFVYEEPLYAPDGTMFLPDFTVKFRGETYYWEHVGRYLRRWILLDSYEQ